MKWIKRSDVKSMISYIKLLFSQNKILGRGCLRVSCYPPANFSSRHVALNNSVRMLKNIKKSWKFQIPDVGPKLILRILLFLQFVGGYLSYLNVYAYFPMTKIEVFPQQVHSTWNVGNTAARTQPHGQEGCSCSAIEVLLRKLPPLSETRIITRSTL